MLGTDRKWFINSFVDRMLIILDFVECVEQINDRFQDYEEKGFAISLLVTKFGVKVHD